MTEPGPERAPEAAPKGVPAPDLESILTEDGLRDAVLALLGNSYDRAVENRTGLSKTTVNDLRNGRRRLTVKTLTLIATTYDPARREEWLAVWHKVRASGTPPAARQDAGTDVPIRSGNSLSSVVAAVPDRPGASWRMLRLAAGSALVAAVATALAILAFANSDADAPGTYTSDDSVAAVTATGAGGPAGFVPGPPPFGPGGPGAAAPVGGPGPPPADDAPPPPLGDGSRVPPGCYSLPLPTTADVVDQPGAAATGVQLTAAAYSYFAAWSPSLAAGGRLSGRPPEGRRVVGAAWADPATADSTAERNPGNGRFYPGNVLELSDQNCFTVPPYNIGYGGYSGITTRIYVLMVDAPTAIALPREAHQLAGLTEDDLVRRGVDVIGYFVVPSPASSG